MTSITYIFNADKRKSNADTRPVESQKDLYGARPVESQKDLYGARPVESQKDLYGARRFVKQEYLRPSAFPPKRLADPPSSMAEDMRESALRMQF